MTQEQKDKWLAHAQSIEDNGNAQIEHARLLREWVNNYDDTSNPPTPPPPPPGNH